MSEDVEAAGPLSGTRVVELAGIGPGPHAAMVLADLGADVVRVERPRGRNLEIGDQARADMGMRGRRSVEADLKDSAGREMVLDLVQHADVLIEGNRPGVVERLGVGPDTCLARNPALVYARITGWGQDGPKARSVGHDINYIGLTGALNAMGRPGEPPTPPLNLVGDYGGGSMLALVGILAALVERNRSGRGQVVDAAMVDGASLLTQMLWALRGMGGWSDERGTNLLDGSAPFYDTYECQDGRYVAVGALEERFFAELVRGLDLDGVVPEQHDRQHWPRMRQLFTERFSSRTRDVWADHFASLDACVTPVLEYAEVGNHPHIKARETVIELGGVAQAAPAPRFSRTPAQCPTEPPQRGSTRPEEVVEQWTRSSAPRRPS